MATVTCKELKESLLKALAAKFPILIVGAPGGGKTDIVYQAAEELGMEVIVEFASIA
ncbi:unnamed protein product, partial [marine sediment metagenome]